MTSENSLPFTEPSEKEHRTWRQRATRIFWQGKLISGFWKTAIIFSLVVNFILIIVLGVLGQQLFTLKNVVNHDIIAELLINFAELDLAPISTTITVQETIQVVDTIPVVFDLPLEQDTQVVLTKDTPIRGATIILNNQPVPLDLTLRQGTPLSINLDLIVPVSQTVPVELAVPVNLKVPVYIEMQDTDLHEPFVGLQTTLSPYFWLLENTPAGWEDTPLCQGFAAKICDWVLILE